MMQTKTRLEFAPWLCVGAALIAGAATAAAGGLAPAALLGGAVAGCLTLANYRIGIWLLVLITPISATTVFPRELFGITGANPYNALFALTLITFLAERLWKNKPVWPSTYPLFWWAFVLPVLIAAIVGVTHFSDIPSFVFTKKIVAFSSSTGYFRDVFARPMMYVMLALLLGMACRDGMKIDAVIVAMCLSMWLVSAWIFYYVASSGVGLSQLASAANREFFLGAGMHANDLGALAACMLILMIFAMADRDITVTARLLYGLTMCAVAMLLALSFSRGAIFGFVVAFGMFFVVQRRLKVIVGVVCALALLLPLLPTELYERLGTGFGSGGSQVLHSADDPLTAGRVAGVWIPLLSEVQAHPIFGNGLLAVAWSFPFRSGAISIASLNPHNLYLKMLLEVGIVGCVVLLIFFVSMWRKFRALGKQSSMAIGDQWFANGAASALLGYGVYGMSGGDYLPDPSNSLLWMAWGMLLLHPHADTKRDQRSEARP